MPDHIRSSGKMNLNLFTLAFPGDLEKDFVEDYFGKSKKHVRIALILAIFFYGIFGVLDAWLVPAQKQSLWLIRYLIFLPFTGFILLLSFNKYFSKYMQAANAAVVLLAGLGIIIMMRIAPYPANNSYYAGLILVFIFGYTFFKLRFIWASAAGWLIVVAYEISAFWLDETPIAVLVNNNFFFLTGNILGMFACYSIEFYLRKEYFISRLLEVEKKKVNEANLVLEKTVEKRTHQLTLINEELNQEIVEKKLNEAALRESEEKYRTIIESIEEGYFEVDLAGHLKFFNESTCNILGYTYEELLGINYREFTDSLTSEKMYKVFNQIYKTGKPVKVMDYGIIRKDGTTRILSMSTSLICDASGTIIGFRGIARDDTDRKLAEEKIRRMNDELEQRVAKRTVELNEANQALKKSLETVQATQDRMVETEKLAALGSLVAGIAHEINTPVGIGVTAASLLDEKTKTILDLYESGAVKRSDFESYLKAASESSTYILSNLQRAADLIHSFKQVATDQSNEDCRPFNIKEYIEDVLLSLRPKLKKTEHEIRLDCSEKLVIYSSPGAFSQLLTNLVMNSLVHGFNGINRGEIDIAVSEADGFLNIQYSDNGKGMDEETLKNIYNPFFTTKRSHGGTGLGMHIVYNLVTQKLGGQISAKSKIEEGTLFDIYVPLGQEIDNEIYNRSETQFTSR